MAYPKPWDVLERNKLFSAEDSSVLSRTQCAHAAQGKRECAYPLPQNPSHVWYVPAHVLLRQRVWLLITKCLLKCFLNSQMPLLGGKNIRFGVSTSSCKSVLHQLCNLELTHVTLRPFFLLCKMGSIMPITHDCCKGKRCESHLQTSSIAQTQVIQTEGPFRDLQIYIGMASDGKTKQKPQRRSLHNIGTWFEQSKLPKIPAGKLGRWWVAH